MILTASQIRLRLSEKLVVSEPGAYIRIEATSVKVHLSGNILVEEPVTYGSTPIFEALQDYGDKNFRPVIDRWYRRTLPHVLAPGDFILAEVQETVNLPADLSAEFRLSSTAARLGLWHSTAVWMHSGWRGRLTLELVNVSRRAAIILNENDPIGHFVFHQHFKVAPEDLYDGKYQSQAVVCGASGIVDTRDST